jgi:hypothetical protein
VDRGLELIAAGAGMVSGARLYALSDGEVRAAVVGAARVLARVEAAFLDLVAALDSRPGAVPGTRPGQGTAAFLHQVVLRSPGQAFRDVAAARVLDRSVGGRLSGERSSSDDDGIAQDSGSLDDTDTDVADPAADGRGDNGEAADGTPGPGVLPVMVVAFRSGRVSRQHLDVAVRTLGKVPAHLVSRVYPDGRSGAHWVDSYLAEQSRLFPPSGTERLGRHLLAVMDPDGVDRFDPVAFERRSLTCSVDGTGMLVGRFQLDPAAGACLRAALDRFSAPHPATAVTRHDGGEPEVGAGPGEGGGQTEDGGTDGGDERGETDQQ